MTDRPYSRVYHEIVDHPRFERVYRNPHALGTWLQMLLTADAMYPMAPEMPPRNPTVRMLIDCGLVVPRSSNRYSMRGLTEERERRAASARIGAVKRWDSERNANAMPRRDETSIDKTSNGANAPTGSSFMGWRPKDPEGGAGLWNGRGSHDGRHGQGCGVCFPLIHSEEEVKP